MVCIKPLQSAKYYMMKPRREIRRLLHPSLYPWGAILMLHRVDVINPDRLWYNEHLKITPDYLDGFLTYAKRKGFSFVSIDELVDILSKKKRVRRIISITLDDGYLDNFTNGLPLFKAHKTPFCIYVATQLPEKKMVYWWYLIEDIILQQKECIILNNGISLPCKTREEKEAAFLSIREEVLKLPQQQFNTEFTNLLNHYSIDLTAYNDTLPFSWGNIRQLMRDPLATIGSHTHSHISLAGCSNKMIIDDIKKSIQILQDKAGIQVRHFAYPFGDDISVKDFHQEIVKEIGLQTIATTNNDTLSYQTDQLALPRIFITERNAYDILDHLYHTC